MTIEICPACGSDDVQKRNSTWAVYYQCQNCFNEFGTVQKTAVIARSVPKMRDASDRGRHREGSTGTDGFERE